MPVFKVHHVEQMIGSIEEFVKLCAGKDHDAIYDMFEEQLAEDVRDELYQYGEVLDPFAAEPVRLVINTLGELHNVQSMKDY